MATSVPLAKIITNVNVLPNQVKSSRFTAAAGWRRELTGPEMSYVPALYHWLPSKLLIFQRLRQGTSGPVESVDVVAPDY